MAVDFETVGSYLENLRLAKHISRNQLAEDLGWSQKTLQRIAQGQVDMKVSQFINILSYLTAEPSEVKGLFDQDALSLERVDGRIISAGANGDVKALEKIQNELAEAAKDQFFPWMKSEILTCELMRAELSGDCKQAEFAATRLFKQFANYEQWTDFDLRMVSRVVSYIPYAQMRTSFLGRDLINRPVGWTKLNDQSDAVLDSFYLGLLDSAVSSGNPEFVLEMCKLIRERVVLWSNYYFRMYKQLAAAAIELLTGDAAKAERMKDKLLTDVGGFIPDNILQHDAQGIQQLWSSMRDLGACDENMG